MSEESTSTHSLLHTSELAVVLFEHVEVSPLTALHECSLALSISPEELDNRFLSWCGYNVQDFIYFSSPSRNRKNLHGVHDLFDCQDQHQFAVPVQFIPMSEAQSKSDFAITYTNVHTPVGEIFIGETALGVCYLSFGNEPEHDLKTLREMFPNAILNQGESSWKKTILEMLAGGPTIRTSIPVHTRCTDFQFRVWTELFATGFGMLTTYGDLAITLGDRNASRAVGSALAANPVAWLIPCHRVVNADGSCGHFRWGAARKKLFLAWEASVSAQRS